MPIKTKEIIAIDNISELTTAECFTMFLMDCAENDNIINPLMNIVNEWTYTYDDKYDMISYNNENYHFYIRKNNNTEVMCGYYDKKNDNVIATTIWNIDDIEDLSL